MYVYLYFHMTKAQSYDHSKNKNKSSLNDANTFENSFHDIHMQVQNYKTVEQCSTRVVNFNHINSAATFTRST